jgi:hypothetical protein
LLVTERPSSFEFPAISTTVAVRLRRVNGTLPLSENGLAGALYDGAS